MLGAVAEDGGAYADEGGAGRYGEGVIVAHANGEGVEAAEVGACQLNFGLEGCDAGEVGCDAGHVVGVRGHCHEAAYVGGPERLVGARGEEGEHFVGREAEFGLFLSHMHLHEHAADYAGALALAVDGTEQALAVNAFYQGRPQGDELAHLVGLKMAYEVPCDVGRKGRHLRGKLLHAALAKKTLAGGIGLGKRLYGMEFRHRHELHSGRNGGADGIESAGYVVHQSTTFIL